MVPTQGIKAKARLCDCVMVMGMRESLAERLRGERDAVRGTMCGMVQYWEDGDMMRTREAGSGG